MKRNRNLRQKKSDLKMRNAIRCSRMLVSKKSNLSRFKFSRNLLLKLKNVRPPSKNRQSLKRSRH